MKKGIVLILILFLGFAAYGQDASKVTEILEAEQLTRAQASYIAVSWLDSANESLDFAETAQIALEQGLLKDGVDVNEPIRLDELAGLCMKAWNVLPDDKGEPLRIQGAGGTAVSAEQWGSFLHGVWCGGVECHVPVHGTEESRPV